MTPLTDHETLMKYAHKMENLLLMAYQREDSINTYIGRNKTAAVIVAGHESIVKYKEELQQLMNEYRAEVLALPPINDRDGLTFTKLS